ncbi:hypothetical protein [Parageobacillus thermoglucosidasius]|uniref:hypothetical protein n=1 Tax=Parageobacillus thermoglucosidasius TaxID=1426 RepID=UPI002E22FA81|nr:hypothetical protein [Parageobacillus thermoglucosidasius]MED4946514.1 hypothetical protein [Parageobacillus thermoglucosidasius]MED4984075.1 hypothetical protein [Parageobacillus thermoglucosidasius]
MIYPKFKTKSFNLNNVEQVLIDIFQEGGWIKKENAPNPGGALTFETTLSSGEKMSIRISGYRMTSYPYRWAVGYGFDYVENGPGVEGTWGVSPTYFSFSPLASDSYVYNDAFKNSSPPKAIIVRYFIDRDRICLILDSSPLVTDGKCTFFFIGLPAGRFESSDKGILSIYSNSGDYSNRYTNQIFVDRESFIATPANLLTYMCFPDQTQILDKNLGKGWIQPLYYGKSNGIRGAIDCILGLSAQSKFSHLDKVIDENGNEFLVIEMGKGFRDYDWRGWYSAGNGFAFNKFLIRI